MTAHSTPSSAETAIREAIARIVDPNAWIELDDLSPTERDIRSHNMPLRRDMALSKADAILSSQSTALDRAQKALQEIANRKTVGEMTHPEYDNFHADGDHDELICIARAALTAGAR